MTVRQLAGRPTPLGATPDAAGVNFAVHSDVADRVAVCLFDEAGAETTHWLQHRTGSTHHGYLVGIGPGARYGLRVDGPWDPAAGLRCNPHKLLIDPYAGSIAGEVSWDPAVFGFRPDHPDVVDRTDSAPFVPRSVVVDHDFDWGDDSPPQTRWADTVIYETHVKSLTRLHAAVPDDLRGTYLGLVSDPVLDHLKGLGVTAVELMPVHHFVDDQALAAHGLRNLWGYQPIGWFAPHAGYATAGGTGPVAEFKEMVRRLHAAGLEVVLDVVYNHTAESHQLGPHLSLAASTTRRTTASTSTTGAGISTTPAPGTPSTPTTRPCREPSSTACATGSPGTTSTGSASTWRRRWVAATSCSTRPPRCSTSSTRTRCWPR